MKKKLYMITALSLLLVLAACGNQPAPAEGAGYAAPAYMKEALPAAELDTEVLPAAESAAPETHTYTAPTATNVMEHDFAGYCGNTITTVRCRITEGAAEPWDASFWGTDSVALTDLLRFLDYSGEVCRCPDEYIVDTEFGSGFGLNLTEGFARHDGGQVDLTAEQIETIQGIIERNGTEHMPGEWTPPEA